MFKIFSSLLRTFLIILNIVNNFQEKISQNFIMIILCIKGISHFYFYIFYFIFQFESL